MHNELIGTMDQYIVELKNLRRTLPRRDIVLQYGRLVVWAYVKIATGASDALAATYAQDLLDLTSRAESCSINWVRDRDKFKMTHPHFWEILHDFLKSEHESAVTSPFPW